MSNLPPEMALFADYMAAQPEHIKDFYSHLIITAMVEAGNATLIQSDPGEAGLMCTYRIVTGDVITLRKPKMTEAEEADMVAKIRKGLADIDQSEADS